MSGIYGLAHIVLTAVLMVLFIKLAWFTALVALIMLTLGVAVWAECVFIWRGRAVGAPRREVGK